MANSQLGISGAFPLFPLKPKTSWSSCWASSSQNVQTKALGFRRNRKPKLIRSSRDGQLFPTEGRHFQTLLSVLKHFKTMGKLLCEPLAQRNPNKLCIRRTSDSSGFKIQVLSRQLPNLLLQPSKAWPLRKSFGCHLRG